MPADELILGELLPVAREGLQARGIDAADIDRYLGVLEDRVRSKRTGAQWQLDSYGLLRDRGGRAERLAAITAATIEHQKEGRPVHTWPLASLEHAGGWEKHYARVGQFMTSDLVTVGPEEGVELVMVDPMAGLLDVMELVVLERRGATVLLRVGRPRLGAA